MKAYYGTIINPIDLHNFETWPDSYLLVDGEGKVMAIQKKIDKKKFPQLELIDYRDKLILPGFIDTHTHLPQFAFSGTGDLPLLPWLKKYTFPQEERFAKENVVRIEADNFFSTLLRNGTTTVVAYVTSHASATDIAFSRAQKYGIRAFLGQVLMDVNGSQKLLVDHGRAREENIKLIEKWHRKTDRLQFVITPRFAVSCGKKLLETAGELAQKYNLFIQTHLSENTDEIEFVKKLFPDSKDYTSVYDDHGCLTAKTLLGHSIHLSTRELALIKRRKAIMTHCPTSNRFLGSGVMPLMKYLEQGQKVTLGTDVAAGYSLSMANEAKEAIESSKMYNLLNPRLKMPTLSLASALYLATLGAATSLQQNHKYGNFSPGKEADFIVIDDLQNHPLGAKDVLYIKKSKLYLSAEEKLSRFFYRNNSQSVIATFIRGQKVF